MSRREGDTTMGIDPGLTCGWAVSTGAWGAQPHGAFLPWLFLMLGQQIVDHVAIERFHTRQLTREGEETLEVIGAIKVICQIHEVSFTMVNPSDKKKTMPDVDLQITNKHARDAEAIRLWDERYGKW